MRTSHFSLAAVMALAIAFPTLAAEKPRPAKRSEDQPGKIWTNEDMDRLRLRGLISVVGEQTNEAPPKPAAASQPSGPAYASRLEDPDWYAQQAADLQAQLEQRQAALQDAQNALANAADGITEPGVAMDKGNVGVTPEAGIAILEAESLDIQRQLDDLSDLARQNNIPPGVLRG
jgi:hypothetical protein